MKIAEQLLHMETFVHFKLKHYDNACGNWAWSRRVLSWLQSTNEVICVSVCGSVFQNRSFVSNFEFLVCKEHTFYKPLKKV